MKERQVSFAGGVLDPKLWGRTDLDRYPIGTRSLLNFIVTPHGVLTNRTGTRHFGWFTDEAMRLIPFESSYGSALLAFVDEAIWIFIPNALGVFTMQTNVATDIESADIASIKVAQVGNTMTIVTPNSAPCELRRTGSSTWVLEVIDFDIPDAPTWAGEAKLELDYERHSVLPLASVDPDHEFDGNSSHPAREWSWAITRLMRNSSGQLYETRKQVVTEEYDAFGNDNDLPERIAVYPDWTQNVVWGDFGRTSLEDYFDTDGDPWHALDNNTSPPSGADVLVKTRIYRGRDGHYGYIGETTSNHFVDDGATPDFSSPPPEGVNPFKVYDAELVLQRTENPSVVTFFEGRRHFAATEQRPVSDWASAIDDFDNYDEILPADSADSLRFDLSSKRFDRIRHLVPRRQLLALTSAGAWAISGSGQGELITPLGIAARPVGETGCADAPIAEAGQAIFFVERGGSTIHAIIPDGDGYRSVDTSLLSRSLFDGYSIIDMAYARNPHSVLWVVRSDGVLLSLTYVAEQGVLAWAYHEIAGGLVESIAVVSNEDEDIVCMSVTRGSVHYLERMASDIFDDIRDAVYLDLSVTYDGRNTDDAVTVTITDSEAVTTGTLGEEFTATFSTDPGLLAGDRFQVVDPDQDEPLRFEVSSVTGGGAYLVQLMNIAFEDDLFGEAISEWATCAISVGDLHHLEGETVYAVVDGNVHADLVVEAGAVEFDDYFAVAHVGLQYNSDFESLDAINEKGREKIVSKVTLELDQTRGGKVGAALDGRLAEVRTREVSDGYLAIDSKRVDVDLIIQDTWNKGGRVAFRQDQPLPVAILGITRDIKHGGD